MATGRADTIIRDGWVIDGSNTARFRADVAVVDGRIAAVGDLADWSAANEVDAAGRIVAPGFIDVHTHDDCALVNTPAMTAKLSQGVTTVVVGNCGASAAPFTLAAGDWPPDPLDLLGDRGFDFPRFADYVARLETHPPAINAAPLVGHTTLRHRHVRDLSRAASEEEIQAMERDMEQSMADGALGLSTGLDYKAALGSSTEEVVRLARVAARHGGIFTCHHRAYFSGIEDALEEAFDIGHRGGLPMVISHHQCSGRDNFGKAAPTLAQIERARRRQTIGLDVYPYAASSKTLDPDRCQPGVRVLVTRCVQHPDMVGKDISQVAAEWGCATNVEAAERLVPANAVYFQLDENDVRTIVGYPSSMIGSDGLPADDMPHPRLWGTFPRVFARYVREEAMFPTEMAVFKMTGLSARQFGFADRGFIAAGMAADIVVFDEARIDEQGTWEKPAVPAVGIDLVMVNGQAAWRHGRDTGARAGQMLRRDATIAPYPTTPLYETGS